MGDGNTCYQCIVVKFSVLWWDDGEATLDWLIGEEIVKRGYVV